MSDRFDSWIRSVATGAATMSQRNVRWVETNGGADELCRIARAAGVHLVQLTDDRGVSLVAASRHPFTVLC